jgi:hypothetical protein
MIVAFIVGCVEKQRGFDCKVITCCSCTEFIWALEFVTISIYTCHLLSPLVFLIRNDSSLLVLYYVNFVAKN